MSVIVRICDIFPPFNWTTLEDIIEVNYSTIINGGFEMATIKLSKPLLSVQNGMIFNNHLEILSDDGTKVWEGCVHKPYETTGSDYLTVSLTAIGYQSNLSHLTASWKPDYPLATDIAQIIREGVTAYCNALICDTTTAPDVNKDIIYTPDNPADAKTHIEEILKYGNQNHRSLMYQVWEDRKLYIKSRPDLAENEYETSISNLESVPDIGINADNFYTRISIKWRDVLQTNILVKNNVPMQNLYASNFGSLNGAARVPFIREPAIVDITSHGAIDEEQAEIIGVALIKKFSEKGLQLVTNNLVFNSNSAIIDSRNKQPVDLAKIRAGNSILVTDYPGIANNSTSPQAGMVIYRTNYSYSYVDRKEKLEISSESGTTLDNILSKLLNETNAYPED